ncbi:hypothetical protein [Polyangium jinanense]|uniref:WD40 repeat domain-containing protein n=1 Tax=Polyangium jinanense TaxID=2829994 RepID=A0A9X3X6F5_9BACT|nr:hypothetical protein [Polyangium jinanense]MDC3984512.1 hypothetical protein [Polyangium jinanense]
MRPAFLALALVVLAGCRSGSSNAPAPSGSASASTQPAPASGEPVAVPQKAIQAAPMLFHPTLPLVAQVEGEHCDVWDLGVGLYRGSVPRADCERWRPARREVPEKIAKGTPMGKPAQSTHPDDPPQEDVGQLVAAWSPDGKQIATGRKGSSEVYIWDAASGELSFSGPLPAGQDAEPARLEDLAWPSGGKLIAAALPAGAFLWDPNRAGDRPKAIESNMQRYERVWLDPATRYLGGSGRSPAQRSLGHMTSVVALADGRELLADRKVDVEEARRELATVSAVWAPSGTIVYAIRKTPIPAEACEDHSIDIAALDLATGDVKDRSFERAVLHAASASPDGRALLLSLTNLGECGEQYPGDHHASKAPATELHRLDEEKSALWSIPVEASSLTWSPRGDAVAFVTGAHIEVRNAGRDELFGRMKGGPPIAFSPDGSLLGYSEGGTFVVRPRSGKGAPTKFAEGVVAAAWGPKDVIALATKEAVMVRDGKTGESYVVLPVPAVVRMEWSPEGDSLYLATDDGSVSMYDLKKRTEVPRPLKHIMGYRRIHWTPDGALVIINDGISKKFVGGDRAWVQSDTHRVADWKNADPTGRFELVAGPAVRRLADGEVLHFDPRTGPWTDSRAFARKAPEDWVFREGPDVLAGRLVRSSEATFLLPTPDLVTRFVSGTPVSSVGKKQ